MDRDTNESTIDAVTSRKCGVNHAATDYGVLATTLEDRLSGRVKKNSSYLSAKQVYE